MSTPEHDDLLLFTPVPAQRVTAVGWSAEVQRAFVANLAKCGVVSAAARSVGRTARSAWMVRRRAGAEGFAAAWDVALEMARDRAIETAIERMHAPEQVPVLYRGRIVGWRQAADDGLLIAALRAMTASSLARTPPKPGEPESALARYRSLWDFP